jgi:hypothetical protein
MEILKFEGGAPRGRAKSSSNKKTIRVAVALGAVALVGVLSSTLAANITINSGANVEFGQGLSGAAACDASLTLTPISGFKNTNGSTGYFTFDSLTVADASTTNGSTGLALCANKYIKLAAYDSSSATALTLSSSSSQASSYNSFEVLIGATSSNGLAAVTLATPSAAQSGARLATTTSSFTIGFSTNASTATAGAVYKITVESHS